MPRQHATRVRRRWLGSATRLSIRRAVPVLVLIGACYGSEPELLSDHEPEALTSADAGAGATTDPELTTDTAPEEQRSADLVADVLRELEALYAQPARTQDATQGSDRDQGTEIDPDVVEFARLLDEQLHEGSPKDSDAAAAPNPVTDGEGDAGVVVEPR